MYENKILTIQQTVTMIRILSIALCITTVTNAEFSFKSLTQWATGSKEQTFFEEHVLENKSTLFIENSVGSLSIKSWSLNKIAIEAIKNATEKDLPAMEINTLLREKHLSIISLNKTKQGTIDYQIIVPVTTNIIAKTDYGSIKIKNVHGNIQATTNKGSIDIQGAANNVCALSSGSVTINYSSLPLHGSHSLKSNKNAVTISFPVTIDATIKANTRYNSIVSEHFITLDSITTLLNKHTWENFKHHVHGKIGTGSTFFDISAHTGITILQNSLQ